jgi:hypothetical protein
LQGKSNLYSCEQYFAFPIQSRLSNSHHIFLSKKTAMASSQPVHPPPCRHSRSAPDARPFRWRRFPVQPCPRRRFPVQSCPCHCFGRPSCDVSLGSGSTAARRRAVGEEKDRPPAGRPSRGGPRARPPLPATAALFLAAACRGKPAVRRCPSKVRSGPCHRLLPRRRRTRPPRRGPQPRQARHGG